MLSLMTCTLIHRRLTTRSHLPAGLVLAVVALCAAGCARDPIEVRDARIRDLPPGRDTTAAYFVLHNHSGETVKIVGASSKRARAIEMHTTTRDGDRVAMRRLEAVEIPSGASAAFAPGGQHLMVFGVTQVTAPFPISIELEDGRRIEVSFSKLAL
jgi:copper(I)-binding protein